MLYDDYLQYTQKYQAQYGSKTVVLMEVGSFFELYAVESNGHHEGAPMSEVCSLLNIQSTKKNKSIALCSRNNPLMAGFPSANLKKYIDMLIADQFTVVLVEQTTPPPNPERNVTQVISPATYMDTVAAPDSRYMMVWYLSTGYDRFKKETYHQLSVVYADVTTGETFAVEDVSQGDDAYVIQEATRLLTASPPKELVLIADSDVSMSIRSAFSALTERICVHRRMDQSIAEYTKIGYQNAMLRKVFTDTGMMSPIEYIDMERHPSLVAAFTYLLQFIYEHNETLLHHVRRPTWIRQQSVVRVTHNALEQLNIVPKPGADSSLIKMLNTCETSIGKRRFHRRLTTPFISVGDMDAQYNLVDACIPHYTKLKPMLAATKDIERLFHRIRLLQLQPSEWIPFMISMEHIVKLGQWCRAHSIPIVMEGEAEADAWMKRERTRWNLDAMALQLNQVETSIYKRGVHPELDDLSDRLAAAHARFKEVVDKTNARVGQEVVKIDQTAEKVYQITITKKRWETFLASDTMWKATPYSSTNTTILKLSFDDMSETQHTIFVLTNELREGVKIAYLNDLRSYAAYTGLVEHAVEFLGDLDVGVTSAKNAATFSYTRPVMTAGGQAMIQAKGVRHPLIERVNTDIPYVANDVDLGGNGMLLHGINASGKSSYMKSVGMNVIMAQAGMFVAAASWHSTPYVDIFTRIPGGDNLFKGHSTFVVEMTEVRSMLKYSSDRSLILGDELASGTESVSAISIVAAGIVTLAKKRASFVFATHLHEVAQLDQIKALTNVRVCHMSVHYDETTRALIYDRLLKEGGGETLYGLEVCKSLDMPDDFLHLANTIRQSYLDMSPQLVVNKVSRYSTDVYVDRCSVCGEEAKEVHHIQEQHKADQNGRIDTFHKNTRHNLMTVCDTCHDRIHNKEIVVGGYTMTSHGVRLAVTKPNETVLQEEKDQTRERVKMLRSQGHSIGSIALMVNITAYMVNQYLAK